MAAASLALLAGCAPNQTAGIGPPPAANAPPSATMVPPGMQYLYGSGESAAISVESWHALTDYVARTVMRRARTGVVLAANATLASPAFMPCGDRPPAVIFDVDETVLLNLGAEYDAAVDPRPFDPKRWDLWERTGAADVVATPGAVEALTKLRALGLTVVFNTNRSARNADQTAAAIDGAGLGPAVHGQTLYLAGDDATGGHKDMRRATIAKRYCVVAMGGDQLGDFSDLFNEGLSPARRRSAVTMPAIASLWGAGWFVMPNPTYGTALKGGIDDVFPAGKRWSPPLQEK